LRECGCDVTEQVLLVASEMKLVKLGRIALDGTKVKANASKHRALSHGHLAPHLKSDALPGVTRNSIIFRFQRQQERCSCNYIL
jgi:hypothetical protein